ncbi:MAG: hypothetical protein ACI8RD_003835 [Bacillariaceae sp.]|jgi:hypothetical protein
MIKVERKFQLKKYDEDENAANSILIAFHLL